MELIEPTSIILQKETLGSYTLSDTINRIRHDNC